MDQPNQQHAGGRKNAKQEADPVWVQLDAARIAARAAFDAIKQDKTTAKEGKAAAKAVLIEARAALHRHTKQQQRGAGVNDVPDSFMGSDAVVSC